MHLPKPVLVLGQPSWPLKSRRVEAWVTVKGGHLGPVTFRCGKRKVSPFSVAPWAEERLSPASPPILQVLRGDFFCLPFGGNATAFRGERHPVHGETANATWTLRSLGDGALHASLATRTRPGRVDKHVRLGDDDACVYQRHVVSGMAGPMDFGHHLMLRFSSPGRISASRFVFGQVLPGPFEEPAAGGYQSLRPAAQFRSLARVPTLDGGWADLSRYPARKGFEDLVLIAADTALPFSWTAVSFPEERFVCFNLKDPRVLRSTVFWISNGGRHYAPWNGRHVGVLGMEEVTAYFHYGLAESAAPNSLSKRGCPTSVRLNPRRPLVVNTIFGVAEVPRGFGKVASISALPGCRRVRIRAEGGQSVAVPVDLSFLGGR
jgi:hypothetical protein